MADKKKVDDAVFEVLMKQAFEMYAEKIENEPEPEFSEEALAMAEARKDKIYKDLMKQIDREERKKKWSYKRIIVLAAAISVFIVVLVLNASAVKNFFIKTYTQIQGDVLKISADYDKFNETYDNIEKFQAKNELVIPTWLPNETQFSSLQDSEMNVILEYTIKDKYLNFDEKYIDGKNNIEDMQLENNDYKVQTISVLGYEGTLVRMEYESHIIDYTVIWNTDDIQYKIKTNLSQNELNTILYNLQYYKKIKK